MRNSKTRVNIPFSRWRRSRHFVVELRSITIDASINRVSGVIRLLRHAEMVSVESNGEKVVEYGKDG